MSKISGSVLNLPPEDDHYQFSAGGSLIPLNEGYYLTPERGKLVREAHRQRMGMVATQAKAIYGINLLGEVDCNATYVYSATAAYNMNVKLQAQGEIHQDYVDEFCHRMTQESALQIHACSRAAADNIIEIIRMSPFPPPEEPFSIRKWLFG